MRLINSFLFLLGFLWRNKPTILSRFSKYPDSSAVKSWKNGDCKFCIVEIVEQDYKKKLIEEGEKLERVGTLFSDLIQGNDKPEFKTSDYKDPITPFGGLQETVSKIKEMSDMLPTKDLTFYMCYLIFKKNWRKHLYDLQLFRFVPATGGIGEIYIRSDSKLIFSFTPLHGVSLKESLKWADLDILKIECESVLFSINTAKSYANDYGLARIKGKESAEKVLAAYYRKLRDSGIDVNETNNPRVQQSKKLGRY